MPDIADIPKNEREYVLASKGLMAEQCAKIANSASLLPTQQKYLSWHHHLGHLTKTKMKVLIWIGILPRRPKKLRIKNYGIQKE
eukprot:4418925-Ditylum_brightwellii.AAC.1